MIRPLLFSCLFLITSNLFSQIDTEFWFAAPEITDLHADRPVYLRISTFDEPAKVKIEFAANLSSLNEQIPANSSVSIELTDYLEILEDSIPDQVLDNGLHITSSSEITTYYEVLGTGGWNNSAVNCDIFTLKGKNALGNKFYIPLQNHWDNYPDIEAYSSFDIVATEDETEVIITPSEDLYGTLANRSAGQPFTIKLNKGQTFSCRSLSTLGSKHPTGSMVTSNKPIAITIKDDSLFEAPGWDLAGDQLIPVDIVGTEYIVTKASDSANVDRVFICATENNTEVYLAGNTIPSATIQAGETFSYQLPEKDSLLYIQTSHPAYLNHICGFTYEIAGAILPPLVCSGSRRVAVTRPNENVMLFNLIIPAGKEGYFKINGTPLSSTSVFHEVPGTSGKWKVARITIPLEQIPPYTTAIITNDSADFQLSMMSGDSDTFRYGYFSDFAGLELGPDKAICQGESVTINAGFGKSSYLWNTGATTQKITVSTPGKYYIDITKGSCQRHDTINLKLNPDVPEYLTYRDTAVCKNVKISIGTDSLFSSYNWNTGAKTPKIEPTSNGMYYLEVKNIFDCKRKDSINVTFHELPKAEINYIGDLETICWDSLITIKSNVGPYKYQWSTGETSSTISVPHQPIYKVTITDPNGCKDSTSLKVDCSPFIKVFNLVTPDGNGKNEVFYVEGLDAGKWILEVYDRWGGRVYYSTSYNNDFDGKDLPSAIYYYVLKHVEGKNTISGWVHILKDEK